MTNFDAKGKPKQIIINIVDYVNIPFIKADLEWIRDNISSLLEQHFYIKIDTINIVEIEK